MDKISFTVQPFELGRHKHPFEITLLTAQQTHLAPPAGSVLMSMGDQTFLIKEKRLVAPISAGDFIMFPQPAAFITFEKRDPDKFELPQVHLRNALMACKNAGLRGSQIEEIWNEFVARQVLED